MARKVTWKQYVLAGYVIVNLGGGVFALAQGEAMHALLHGVLLLIPLSIYLSRRIAPRERLDFPRPVAAEQLLERMQQSVDAIAVEVERIGEAQRFNAKLIAERNRKKELS